MRRSFVVVVVVLVSALAAVDCSKDETSPTAPTTPAAPTVTSLSIAGVDTLLAHQSELFTASVALSDGTTQPATTATWTSSDPSVATVDSTGRFLGASHGSVNLTASYQGQSASKNVTVVNNYGGTWTGSYFIRTCNQSGDFVAQFWCQRIGGVGAIKPVSLALTQSGNDLSQIRGTISLGEGASGEISGGVTGDGRLNISGSFPVNVNVPNAQLTVGGWDTRVSGGNSMTGRWSQNLTAIPRFSGNVYQEDEIRIMTQTSRQIAMAKADGS